MYTHHTCIKYAVAVWLGDLHTTQRYIAAALDRNIRLKPKWGNVWYFIRVMKSLQANAFWLILRVKCHFSHTRSCTTRRGSASHAKYCIYGTTRARFVVCTNSVFYFMFGMYVGCLTACVWYTVYLHMYAYMRTIKIPSPC